MRFDSILKILCDDGIYPEMIGHQSVEQVDVVLS